jgi:hypothetical protein
MPGPGGATLLEVGRRRDGLVVLALKLHLQVDMSAEALRGLANLHT